MMGGKFAERTRYEGDCVVRLGEKSEMGDLVMMK